MIHGLWHKAINAQALDDLMSLYKERLRTHFRAFFDLVGPPQGREWTRLPVAASEGKTLIWEYPSAGVTGDQLDVVESFDIDNGLILYHRVYWGRIGFKLLNGARDRGAGV